VLQISYTTLAIPPCSADALTVTVLPYYPPIEAKVSGHQLKFVFGGAERFALLLEVIAGARETLQLYFYAFGIDDAGRKVTDALIEARDRGVEVSLLVDGFGTHEQPDQMFVEMAEAGIKFARFEPRYGRRYLLRNHQKMLIADGTCAVVGGSNIEEAYFADDPDAGSWHDIYLRIEGDAVARLADYHTALAKWIADPNAGIRSLVALLGRHSDNEGALRWLFGGPSKRLNSITRALREGIVRGNQVDMVQAYFAPNWGFLRKLGKAATRGRFRLITAAKSDNNTTIAAARHCYRRLLRRSAEIYEYQPERLHMKLVVIDDVTYVGSANFDMRSLYLNTEIMLRIDDAKLADQMRQAIDDHCAHSKQVTRETHRADSSWYRRVRWLLGYLIVTALDYRLTRNLNWKTD
jgi:cardiolipin synthase A/B